MTKVSPVQHFSDNLLFQATPGQRTRSRRNGRGLEPATDFDGSRRCQRVGLPQGAQVRPPRHRLQELPRQLNQGRQIGRLWNDQVRTI